MTKKNGKDSDDSNIIRIPTLKERDRIAREKREAERKTKKTAKKSPWSVRMGKQSWGSGDGSPVGPRSSGNGGYQKSQPFFNTPNIPPFARYAALSLLIIHAIITLILPASMQWQIQSIFAFVPAYFTGAEPMPSLLSLLGPITHMTLHGDWMHAIMNAFMLLAFGTMVERTVSTRQTITIFISAGIAGALAFMILNWGGTGSLVGASGGISGLFGTALIMMHNAQALPITLPKPLAKTGAWGMIIIWALIMTLFGLLLGGNIAWQAHLAGLFAGPYVYRQIQKGNLRV